MISSRKTYLVFSDNTTHNISSFNVIYICVDSYPKLPKVLHIYPFYAYQGRPKQPYVYVRCLLRNRKRDRSVRYLFHLHKIKQSKDGKTLKTVVDRTETTRSYFDVRLIPEKYPVTLGDTVKECSFLIFN